MNHHFRSIDMVFPLIGDNDEWLDVGYSLNISMASGKSHGFDQ